MVLQPGQRSEVRDRTKQVRGQGGRQILFLCPWADGWGWEVESQELEVRSQEAWL